MEEDQEKRADVHVEASGKTTGQQRRESDDLKGAEGESEDQRKKKNRRKKKTPTKVIRILIPPVICLP